MSPVVLPPSGLATDVLGPGSPATPALPPSGLASDLLDRLPPPDPGDPARLQRFVEAVGPSAEQLVAPPEPTVDLVGFRLGEELFALPVDRIREVVRVGALTRVPQAPEHVRGVHALRGAILPVLEVRTRLGLSPAVLGPLTRIVVAEGHRRLLGLLVDSVEAVVRIPRSELRDPPPEVRSRCTEHVVGVASLGGRLALLLDVDRLLFLPSPAQEGALP